MTCPSLISGKERDTESGSDNFGPRYYGSNMGRFMSPDEFGGHLEDPQTLNKYSYVGNNPLSRTDPSGHDFWQSCDKASSTCGNQQIGTNKDGSAINHLVQGTTDSNGKFSSTVITSASLGQAGSGNSATVNGTGVEVTSKTGTAQGSSSTARQVPTSKAMQFRQDGASSLSTSTAITHSEASCRRVQPHTAGAGSMTAW